MNLDKHGGGDAAVLAAIAEVSKIVDEAIAMTMDRLVVQSMEDQFRQKD